jgi:hypothetical protein
MKLILEIDDPQHMATVCRALSLVLAMEWPAPAPAPAPVEKPAAPQKTSESRSEVSSPSQKKRGRPPGAKNKPHANGAAAR